MTDIKTTAEAVEAAVLPDAYVVHADPNAPQTAEQKPLPPEMCDEPIEQKSPAQWAYERLVLYIQNFEEQLDGDHEIGMGFAGGEVGVMRIQGIGFFCSGYPDILWRGYGRRQNPACAACQPVKRHAARRAQGKRS